MPIVAAPRMPVVRGAPFVPSENATAGAAAASNTGLAALALLG